MPKHKEKQIVNNKNNFFWVKKLNNKKHAEKNKNKTAFALTKAKEIIMPIQKKGIKKGNRFIGFCGVSRCIFPGSLKETCVIARFERSSNRGNPVLPTGKTNAVRRF